MQNKNQIQNPKPLNIEAKPASFLAAGSLAVLINLSFWRYELNSILRLFLQSGVLSIGIWLGLHYFFYRKLRNPISFDYKVLIICIISSFFFSFQIIPPQVTYIRYVLTVVITSFMFLFFYLSFLIAFINNEKIRWNSFFSTLAFICGFAGMLIIIISSLSARMYSDDFYHAVQLEKMGLWKSALWFYMSWSGSFFSNFLIMGLSNQYRAPFFFLIFILISFFLSLVKIVKNNPLERWLSALAGAFFIPFTVFTVTPDLYKSLFWICSCTGVFPLLIMIPIYLAIIAYLGSANQRSSRRLLIFGMVLCFAITTTHEVASLGWAGMQIIGLIWFYVTGSKNVDQRNFLLAGALATLIGLTVMLVSPGGQARITAEHYLPSPPVTEVILSTTRDFLNFIKKIPTPYYKYHGEMRPGWFLIIAAAGLGWLTDTPFRRHLGKAALVLISSIGMAAVSFIIGAYLFNYTPLRTQLIPSFYLVFGVFIFGMFLPRVTNNLLKTSITILIMMIMFFGSRISVSQLMLTIEPVRQYARDWDLRDKTVRLTEELPQRIDVPWEDHEAGFKWARLYYQTR